MDYEILSTTETTRLDEAGHLEEIVRIRYRIGETHIGKIELPMDEFDANTVRQMIEGRAREIEKLYR